MSTKLEERLEKIMGILENLAVEASSGIPIVVEGIKDLKALNKLKVKGDIILAKSSGKSVLEVLKEIENRGKSEVILLLDFDRRGREWMNLLAKNLEREGIKPNTTYWRKLRNMTGKELKDIEGLFSCLETFKRKLGVFKNETI